jgi:glutamate-5-semialdehyde dehydrogenase
MENLTGELAKVQKASHQLSLLEPEQINEILLTLAGLIQAEQHFLLAENQKDLDRMDSQDPRYDRLQLTESRLGAIAEDLRNVVKLEYPVGKILEEKTLPNGLHLTKVSVPLGVIGIIYEARPNVTFDVFSLCLKSGNACVLKGGKEAAFSNQAIMSVIHKALAEHNTDPHIVYLLPNDREALEIVLNADKYIDVIIPRGSQELINFVRKNSRIPVIETGAGIVHTYFDQSGNLDIAGEIIFNAKTRRPSVCNSLDTLIIHQERLADLPELVSRLDHKVEIFADQQAYRQLRGKYSPELLKPAEEADFGREFLSLKMSVKTVADLAEAIEHITRYSSKHSEAIIAENEQVISHFVRSIDAAAVYVNTSTAFTDGSQFGMGAEIGISTQKLHARGPMALRELTSYKWIVRGEGQVRN